MSGLFGFGTTGVRYWRTVYRPDMPVSVGLLFGLKAIFFNSYLFTESAGLLNTSYYRIKQTDKDGNFTLSATIRLPLQKSVGITVFPNPFVNTITIVAGERLMHSQIKISDIAGRIVQQVRLDAQSTILDLHFLKPGVYLVKVEDGTIQKIVKQ